MADTGRNNPLHRVVRSLATRRQQTCSAHCSECGSDAAAVADCRPLDDEQWTVQLRCGECARWRELVVSDAELKQMEHVLMAGWHAIERTFQDLARKRMAAEIELFVTALDRDLIDADDFAPRLSGARR
jgi:hypothetical protein